MPAYGALRKHGARNILSNDTPTETEAGETGEEPKGKGLGLIPMAAAALVAAGVAGGAAFVLTPSAKEENPACVEAAEPHDDEAAHEEAPESEDHAAMEECAADDHAGKSGKDKKKKAEKSHGGGHGGGDAGSTAIKPIGEVQHTDYASFLVMEPMVVSISPIGRSKHLKISLVFETDDDGAAALIENGFYVQDVLNTFLRSVDSEVLEDPAAMSRLRAQLLRRVRAIVPDANVENVLITEFVLT